MTSAAKTVASARPRLGAVSFLHRFGSALNHHVHLHACVEAAANGLARDGNGTGGCCDSSHATQKPRSHDTSRIAWAKLMARVGEEFPLACPNCGGDIRLIAFITEPGPIRKILTPVLLHTERRTARAATGVARSWPARRVGRARANP